MSRILERLCDQLSIRPGEPPSSPDPDTDPSHSSAGSSAELLQSGVSQVIGSASDMGSSQVFDQSSARTGNDVRLCWRLPVCFIALTDVVLLQLQG